MNTTRLRTVPRAGVVSFALTFLLPSLAPDAAPAETGPSTLSAETVAGIQQDQQAVSALRDRKVEALSAEYRAAEAREPGSRIVLNLTNGLLRRPLIVELRRWGGKWLPGTATGYNKSRNPVDAGGLIFAGGSLTGEVKVTFISDGWVPKPGTSHELVYDIAANVEGGNVMGTYRAKGNPDLSRSVASNEEKYEQVRQSKPKYGSVNDLMKMLQWVMLREIERWDDLSGTTGKLLFEITPPAAEKTLSLDGLNAAGLYAASVEIESRADRAYREIRAVHLTRLATLPYETALEISPDRRPLRPAFESASAAETVAEMRERVGRLRALVEAAESWTPGHPAMKIGELSAEDPRFRGYFGQDPLPSDTGKPNIAPAAATEGPETWNYVQGWQVLGPYPGDAYRASILPLPEMVPAARASYKTNPAAENAPWRAPTAQPYAFADIGAMLGEKKNALCYAATEVFSEADQDLWTAMKPDDYCQLWVNDRPVWANVFGQREASVFPVHLAKGRNRLLVRCENGWGDWGFSVKFCVRGRPRTAAEIAAEQSKTASGAEVVSTRGWFGPGHDGVYPDANPVTAWNLDQGINVIWRLPFARKSIATPVIVGNKIFTLAEPHTLVCVDKSNGRVLWKRDSNIIEFLPDPGEREQALADCAREANDFARRELSKAEEDIHKEMGVIEAKLRANPDDEALKAKGEELQKEIERLQFQQRGIRHWAQKLGVKADPTGDTGWFAGYVGYTAATPVTDGEHIWVKHGTAVAACYDLDGNRKWMIRTYFNDDATSSMPSPMLAGDLLVLVGNDGWWRKNSKSARLPVQGPTCHHWMLGVEPKTGKMRWDLGPMRHEKYGGPETPCPVKLTNGREDMWVIVNGQGQVVRAEDGRLLLNDIGGSACYFASPLANGNTVYFTRGGHTVAVELMMQNRDTVGVRTLWRTAGGGVQGTVLYDGLLHCNGGTKCRGEAGALLYLAKDARTGADVARLDPVLPGGSGDDYVPTCAAGKYVFVFGGNAGAVIESGRTPRVLARMKNERMYAQPVFDGDRMYLRTYMSLLCIGRKGPEGEVYEKQTQAMTLMEIFPSNITRAGTVDVVSRENWKCDAATPVEALVTGRMPRQWLCAGPFGLREGEDPLASIGGCEKATPTNGTTVAVNGAIHAFAQVKPELIAERGIKIDASGDGPGGSDRFYYTVLDNRRGTRSLRVAFVGPFAQAWVGGQIVKNPDIVFVRGCGLVPLLVRAQFPADLPPFAKRSALAVSFEEVEDPGESFRAQLAEIEKNADVLRRVLAIAPGTPEATKAEHLLSFVSNRR